MLPLPLLLAACITILLFLPRLYFAVAEITPVLFPLVILISVLYIIIAPTLWVYRHVGSIKLSAIDAARRLRDRPKWILYNVEYHIWLRVRLTHGLPGFGFPWETYGEPVDPDQWRYLTDANFTCGKKGNQILLRLENIACLCVQRTKKIWAEYWIERQYQREIKMAQQEAKRQEEMARTNTGHAYFPAQAQGTLNEHWQNTPMGVTPNTPAYNSNYPYGLQTYNTYPGEFLRRLYSISHSEKQKPHLPVLGRTNRTKHQGDVIAPFQLPDLPSTPQGIQYPQPSVQPQPQPQPQPYVANMHTYQSYSGYPGYSTCEGYAYQQPSPAYSCTCQTSCAVHSYRYTTTYPTYVPSGCIVIHPSPFGIPFNQSPAYAPPLHPSNTYPNGQNYAPCDPNANAASCGSTWNGNNTFNGFSVYGQ